MWATKTGCGQWDATQVCIFGSKDSLHRIHLWLSLDSAIQLFGPFLRYLTCDERHKPLCSSAMNAACGGYFTLNSHLPRKSGPICKQQLTTFHLPVVLSCEIWGPLDDWMTYTPENCCVKTQSRSCIVQQNTVQYTYIMQRFPRTVSTVRMYWQASDAQNIVCIFSLNFSGNVYIKLICIFVVNVSSG